jgi:hemin uptake protein HemP
MAKDDDCPPSAGGNVHARGDRHLIHREASNPLPRVVRSDALLAGASQLAILHNNTLYFLRETRFGKLILTK